MADSVDTLYCMGKDGIPFSISAFNVANGAVGTYLPVDMNQIAVATSPEDFVAPRDFYIKDIIAGAATGTIEVISNGRKTGIMIDYASQQGSSSGRPGLNIPFSRGTQIRFQVIGVLPA